jgi:hypothetical protein
MAVFEMVKIYNQSAHLYTNTFVLIIATNKINKCECAEKKSVLSNRKLQSFVSLT